MRINLSKNKRLLTWISGTSLLSVGLISQSFALPFNEIKQRANYELQSMNSTDTYAVVEYVSGIISHAERQERSQILTFLSHLSRDAYTENLERLLRQVAFRHYENKYSELRYSKNVINEYFRRARILFTLSYLRRHPELATLQRQFLWLMRNILTGNYDFLSATCALEAWLRYVGEDLHATYRIPQNDIFSENYPSFIVPEEAAIQNFINLWKLVNSNDPRYQEWSASNGIQLVKAIKGGTYANLVAHLTGYLLLLDTQTINGIQKTYQQREWLWNKKKVQENKRIMGQAINQYAINQHNTTEQNRKNKMWKMGDVPNALNKITYDSEMSEEEKLEQKKKRAQNQAQLDKVFRNYEENNNSQFSTGISDSIL